MQLNFSLFLIIAEIKGAPDSSILLANKYSSLSSICGSIAFFNYSRTSPLRLQLFKARDLRSFLFDKALMNAMPPSPLSYRSLWVKNKSVNFVFDSRPSLKRIIALGLILLWLMYICRIFGFAFKVLAMGATYWSERTFLIRFKFLNGIMLKSCINASPLILLLSISITLNRFLPERTLIKCCAPSLSISLFDKCNSSRLFPLSIKSHIILHPFDVILLLDKLSIVKLCLFLFERALITISRPSSPILFPLMFNSLIVLLKLKQSSKVFIPCNPISFFFKLKTSRYFLSLRDWPIATAPSAKIPLVLRPSSVIYFLFRRTLLTAFAPPGPIKFYERRSSLRVDCYWMALQTATHPSDIILLFVKSSTNKFLLFSRLLASSIAPSSKIRQSLRCKFVRVSLSFIPFASAFAPSTPIVFPSRSSLVKNFLFCKQLAKVGIEASEIPRFYRVITLRVSLSTRPFAMAIRPSSFKGLLFKLILLSLYLLDKI